ncbi:MAG: hypothetical protein HYU36_06110 [Planctomycetes bacterium]|nr:hypothetical protein [Planctomycetota bacterium]
MKPKTLALIHTTASVIEPLKQLAVELLIGVHVFQCMVSGDRTAHDEKVRAGLADLAERVDVIVLAQASMARVAGNVTLPRPVPVLSSPRSGLAAAARLLFTDAARVAAP